ncbi:MAG: hypothetical protein F4X65_14760 [Chloroflexi bacterium]|nr:hypothetical protein [Chloroflexota bacterium]
MTQLERYAQMMKVDLGQVKANIAYSVSSEGSVLRQTVQAKADKIAIHYDVTSGDSPERVAGLMRNARNGCYARQSFGRPELFDDTINLNGEPFNMDDYPAP